MARLPRFRSWMAAMLMAGIAPAAPADELYVACHSGVVLDAADIRDVFLGEKQYAGTVRLVPIDNAAAQEKFLDGVLKMNGAKYLNAWAKKSFREGIYPPTVKANDTDVLEFIRRTPGSCGYVRAAPPSNFVVLGRY